MPVPILSSEDEAAALWAGKWEPSYTELATVKLDADTREAICDQRDEEPGQALPTMLLSN